MKLLKTARCEVFIMLSMRKLLCRSQMNLCMLRTRHDVSMEHGKFIEGREKGIRCESEPVSQKSKNISTIYQIQTKSRMKLKRFLILMRLNSRKALPFLLPHCCTIQSSLSFGTVERDC